MQAGDLVSLTLEKLGDPEGDRYGVPQVLRRLDLAQATVNDRFKLLRAEAQLVANIDKTPEFAFYTVPVDCSKPETLEYQGVSIVYRTRAEIRAMYSDWRNAAGTPEWFTWGYAGRDVQMVPYPSEDLEPWLEYIRKPGLLSVLDATEIGEAYDEALALMAAAGILTDDDDARDPTKVGTWMQLAESILLTAAGQGSTRGVSSVRRLRSGFVR